MRKLATKGSPNNIQIAPGSRDFINLDKLCDYVERNQKEFTILYKDLRIMYLPWGATQKDNPGCDVFVWYKGNPHYDLANVPKEVSEAYDSFLNDVCGVK